MIFFFYQFITHHLVQNVHRDGDTPMRLWRLKIRKSRNWRSLSVLGFKIVIHGQKLVDSKSPRVPNEFQNRYNIIFDLIKILII